MLLPDISLPRRLHNPAIASTPSMNATRRHTASPKEAPVVTTTLRNLAYERFSQQILAGRLRPGQFLSQRELMSKLGMPLGAVREMIPRLEAGRLIVTVPKRGLQIAHVDLKLIRNAFQLRSMIEREAVQCFLRFVGDEELDTIERAHRAILERARSGRPDPRLDEDALAVDWGLHDRQRVLVEPGIRLA